MSARIDLSAWAELAAIVYAVEARVLSHHAARCRCAHCLRARRYEATRKLQTRCAECLYCGANVYRCSCHMELAKVSS